MSHIIGTLPGDRLAGLSIDHFEKIRKGVRTLDEWALFLQGRNPFAFERNEHGHVVITVTGLDLTGEQEIERLAAASFRLSDWAKLCLLSRKADGYDKNHRLENGRTYKVAFMPGKEIERDSERTTENLWKRGIEKYGYKKPLAGIMPRIREVVSDKQLEKMDIWYVAALHDPIKDSDGSPCVLSADRYDDGRWLRAGWGDPRRGWLGGGGFAFLVSAS